MPDCMGGISDRLFFDRENSTRFLPMGTIRGGWGAEEMKQAVVNRDYSLLKRFDTVYSLVSFSFSPPSQHLSRAAGLKLGVRE